MKVGAVAAKELWGLLRQPRLLLLLLVGPVAIMVVFALSFEVESLLLPRILVVVEPGSEGAELFEQYRDEFAVRASYLDSTDDLESARQRLLRGDVDAVISVPSSPSETVAEGEQAVLGVTYSTINPVFGTAVPERSYSLVSNLNLNFVQQIISENIGEVRSAQEQVEELNDRLEEVRGAAEELASEEARSATADLDEALADLETSLEALNDTPGTEAPEALEEVRETRELLEEVRAAQRGGAEEIEQLAGVSELEQTLAELEEDFAQAPTEVPPRVLANPLRLDLENLASPPGIVGFYAPAVLALLIQHLAVSLASLSVIRERLQGAYEFFEVSPLRVRELLAGKFTTYFGVVLGVNLAVAALLTYFLDIPLSGGAWSMALVMVFLTAASLGLGFLISALAKSQLQAVQVSMLLLIGSAFFTGFLFPISDMGPLAQALSYFLPATYGIRSLQDVMIRGEGIPFFDLAGLLLFAVVCLGLALRLMGTKES